MLLLGFAASLPILSVILLFNAAAFPSMDRLTLALPTAMRKPVAEIAMNRVDAGSPANLHSTLDRILRLDPENAEAWSRRCGNISLDDPAAKLQQCQQAVRFARTKANLGGVGVAQEALNDSCTAEESYTEANRIANASDTFLLRNMGRAALTCGHVVSSIAIFQVAEEHDAANSDTGDQDLTLDREWLVIAHQANHDPKAAAAACTRAHPDWKGCNCFFQANTVTCTARP
jgi:hypothetical protein